MLANNAHLRNFKNLPLGLAEHLIGWYGLVISITQDVGCGVDQLADETYVADDARIVFGLGGGGGGTPKTAEIGVTADVLDEFLFLEPLRQRHQIGGMALFV